MNIISDQAINEDELFSFQVGAHDIDSEVVQETLPIQLLISPIG